MATSFLLDCRAGKLKTFALKDAENLFDLVVCLRTGRALRVPRARARQRAAGQVTAEVMISQRRAEVTDRAVPRHWEGDLIIGSVRSVRPDAGGFLIRAGEFFMSAHDPRRRSARESSWTPC